MSTNTQKSQQVRSMLKQAAYTRRQEAAARMQKSAGLPVAALLKRLRVLANPRVSNPRVLKWLKPFISTKTVRTGIHGTPEEVAAAMEKAYRRAGMPVNGGVTGGASGSVSGSIPGGAGNIAREIAGGAPYKTVTKNRLRLGRLAGAVTAGGAAGTGAYALLKDKGTANPAVTPGKPSPMDLLIKHLLENPQMRNALIGAGIGGIGTAALSDGDMGTRLLKGLAGAAVAGGATYAAPYLYDMAKDQFGKLNEGDANGSI